MDSYSKVPPCLGVIVSNRMSMSTSWRGIRLAVPICFLCMSNVELLVVAPDCWGFASLI